MNSRVERIKVDLVCPHCSKKIRSAWVIRYCSFEYAQLVRVCSKCENVIGVSTPDNKAGTRQTTVTRPQHRRHTPL